MLARLGGLDALAAPCATTLGNKLITAVTALTMTAARTVTSHWAITLVTLQCIMPRLNPRLRGVALQFDLNSIVHCLCMYTARYVRPHNTRTKHPVRMSSDVSSAPSSRGRGGSRQRAESRPWD